MASRIRRVRADCSSLAVQGYTDDSVNYGTEAAGSLLVVYPHISDNSGEHLAADAFAGVELAAYTANTRFPVGTTEVMFTVSDSAPNTASCTINVTITDDEPPVLQCGQITVYADYVRTVRTVASVRTLIGTAVANSPDGYVGSPGVVSIPREVEGEHRDL